jgi:hypothetical protein
MGNITVKLAQSINDYYYGKSNSWRARPYAKH